MKKNWLLVGGIVVLVVAAVLVFGPRMFPLTARFWWLGVILLLLLF